MIDTSEVCKLARDILEKKGDTLELINTLAKVRHELGMSIDEDFLVFAAIDSDADEWPTGESRNLYNQESLRKIDGEKDKYMQSVQEQLEQACTSVLDRFEGS